LSAATFTGAAAERLDLFFGRALASGLAPCWIGIANFGFGQLPPCIGGIRRVRGEMAADWNKNQIALVVPASRKEERNGWFHDSRS